MPGNSNRDSRSCDGLREWASEAQFFSLFFFRAPGPWFALILSVLTTLRIKNLALVPDLTLELAPGYNAITGETGAGKSVIKSCSRRAG